MRDAEREKCHPADPRPFHVALNCARDEVYHARFRWKDGFPEMQGEILLRKLETLAPEIGGAPVMLRRFGREEGQTSGTQTAAAQKPAAQKTQRPGDPATDALFASLNTITPVFPRPDATRLLAVGEAAFLAGREGPWPPVLPLYLKSEAFRTWQARP